MTLRNLTEVLSQSTVWSQLQQMRQQGRVPQALLIELPVEIDQNAFIDRLLAHIVCLDTDNAPCGLCKTCTKVLQDMHPDIHKIQPDNPNGPIKIEQIREMQTTAYQTPQWYERQIWLMNPAEALNQAAASALLKILEEPSATTMFILLSTNIRLLLPTIVSRCQQLHIQQTDLHDDPLRLLDTYPELTPRGSLRKQRLQFHGDIDAILACTRSVYTVSEQWATYPLQDMLWFFATVLTKLIQRRLLAKDHLDPMYQDYAYFSMPWRPESLFEQLDTIYAMLAQVNNHINLNATMVWERLLLDFLAAKETITDVN